MMTTFRRMMMWLSLSHSPDWGVLPWTGHKFNPEAAILPSCHPAILAYSPDGLTLLIYIFLLQYMQSNIKSNFKFSFLRWIWFPNLSFNTLHLNLQPNPSRPMISPWSTKLHLIKKGWVSIISLFWCVLVFMFSLNFTIILFLHSLA